MKTLADIPWPEGKLVKIMGRRPSKNRSLHRRTYNEVDGKKYQCTKIHWVYALVEVSPTARTLIVWECGWLILYHTHYQMPAAFWQLLRSIRKFKKNGILVEMEAKP